MSMIASSSVRGDANASTAYRTASGWTYGLRRWTDQRSAIAAAPPRDALTHGCPSGVLRVSPNPLLHATPAPVSSALTATPRLTRSAQD